MTPSFFCAALATWRAVHAPIPGSANGTAPLDAIVKLSIKALPGARTADTLGTAREGTGVVIDASGLILTIGYLILEAGSILVVTGDGRVFPATVVGYDHASGFGLLRSAADVARRPLALGEASAVKELTTALVAAHAGAGGVSHACVVSRRRFTGWWEYMIEDAIFTAPPRYEHSGAALIDSAGRLAGIASLWVSDAVEFGVAFPGNMFVPIDLLKPHLDDLISSGRSREPPRPWLGLYSEEVEGHVVVTRVLPDAPAARAGVRRGDVILGVAGQSIGGQGEFYRRLWASGAAGADIMLHVLRNKAVQRVVVHSADRMDYLRPWRGANA
ncbi:MAG: serine protease [Betaproteobacteria bacterium]|nr:serine protease [Betaproteobacteria bacterium]